MVGEEAVRPLAVYMLAVQEVAAERKPEAEVAALLPPACRISDRIARPH